MISKRICTRKCATLLIAFLVFPFLVIAQTVTNIFPTRVTTGSKITIIGTGFYSGLESGIDLNLNIESKTFVSATEMTFVISSTSSSDQLRTITIPNTSINSDVETDFQYVAPVAKGYGSSSIFGVKEVYTTWDQNNDGIGFWKSSDFNWSDVSTWPNDRHDLLGFKMNYGSGDVIFSTGVDDTILENQLINLGVDISDSNSYKGQVFKAYSSQGINGTPHSGNYLAMADKIDGQENIRDLNSSVLSTVYDAIIDGVNGLGMGTGITNFNKNADIKFFSGNGQLGALDDVPDLLISQMAQPGGTDIYYYSDVDGNVVGRPIRLSIYNYTSTRLYEWRLDLYGMNTSSGVTYENSYPVQESFGNQEHRGFRMAAFKLEDFEITATNIQDINFVNMGAGGSSDIAFMAYNNAAFEIKSPKVDVAPVSRYICRFPTQTSLDFEALGSVEGGFSSPSDSDEIIQYQWYENFQAILGETSSTFTLPSGLSQADIESIIYKVRIKNEFGAIDIPFKINEGGTPTYWDGSNWVLAPVYDGISINQQDKSLIFSDDYNRAGDLVGCDCTVPAGKNVTIPSGSTMTLYNTLTVEPTIDATTIDGVYVAAVPKGTFTLEDDASLVQIKNVSANLNSGDIKVKRKVEANTLHQYDYVYWSSPVEDFNISEISNTPTYQWDTNAINANGQAGNWVSAYNTVMAEGKGYIVRVANEQVASGFTTGFNGVPNNGAIRIPVFKSGAYVDEPEHKHWNLIGNPYPSAINTDKFLSSNTTIEGRVDLWMHTNAVSSSVDSPFYEDFTFNYGNQYVTYNGVGSSDPYHEIDRNIASGQGFFVQVLEASANTSSIAFTNDMRHDDTESGYDNSTFYRNSSDEASIDNEKQLVWLSITNENNDVYSTLIGYLDGATEEKDRLYDAYTNNNGLNLYSLISEDEKMVIQGLPLPFIDTNTVSLGFKIVDNGIHTIAIGNVKGSVFVEQEQDIYLEDTYTGVIHDLRASPYNFTAEAGVYNDRFILRYAASTLSNNDVLASNTFAYIKNSKLYVKSSSSIESVTVFNMNGQKTTNYSATNNASSIVTQFSFAKGVYIASIRLENGSIVTKKIIN